jgi:hypothetical protein
VSGINGISTIISVEIPCFWWSEECMGICAFTVLPSLVTEGNDQDGVLLRCLGPFWTTRALGRYTIVYPNVPILCTPWQEIVTGIASTESRQLGQGMETDKRARTRGVLLSDSSSCTMSLFVYALSYPIYIIYIYIYIYIILAVTWMWGYGIEGHKFSASNTIECGEAYRIEWGEAYDIVATREGPTPKWHLPANIGCVCRCWWNEM